MSACRSLMPSTRQDESRKFHSFMAAVVALLLTADLLLAGTVHYSGMPKTIISLMFVLASVAIGALPFVVSCWEWRRKWFGTSLDLASTAMWVLAVVFLSGALMQIAARSPAPLVDAISSADRHPDDPDGDDCSLAAALSLVVHRIPGRLRFAMAADHNVTLPAHIVRSCTRRAPFPLATSISIVLTLGLFALWPAVGPGQPRLTRRTRAKRRSDPI